MTHIGTSLATLLEIFQPLLVLFLAKFLLKEKHSTFFYPIAFWAIANAIFLSVPDFQFGNNNTDSSSVDAGLLFGVIAVSMWAFATVIGKYLLNFYSPVQVAFWRCFFASIVSFIYMLQKSSFDFSMLSENIFNILGLATIVGALPLTIYYMGLKNLKAGLATFIELLYALFGVLIPIIQGNMNLKAIHVFASVSLLLMITLLIYFEKDLKSK